ncbi:MAG: hypothetical protein RJB13_1226 [Pseudomonadota bacterium]
MKRDAKIIDVLKKRFETSTLKHPDVAWDLVEDRLRAAPAKLNALVAMEESGGEPDVVAFDPATGVVTFFDCSPESPSGRRSLCYDEAAFESRKQNKPKSSAQALAKELGVEILSEDQYRFLQTLGPFDAKTSSWVKAPDSIRALGGAIFCDLRFGRVFTYHNGAESYYAARGFRGFVHV